MKKVSTITEYWGKVRVQYIPIFGMSCQVHLKQIEFVFETMKKGFDMSEIPKRLENVLSGK